MILNNIVSVRLENFQSHLDTKIEFSNGLNVVVGQSDSGKTAVLRGVRWALFNQPRGTDFLKVGADFVRVTLVLANGATIVRERTSSKNRYIIKKEEEEDLVLEGFGSIVPEEVMNAHQMRPFRIDADHEWQLQVSQQLEGPFLLEQTGSIRAKTIGRMSGAHYLDMAIRDTSKDVSQLSQRVKWKENELDEATKALEPYKPLNDAKKALDQGFSLLADVKKQQQRVQALKQRKEQVSQLNAQEQRLKQSLETVKALDTWELLYQTLQQLVLKRQQLRSVQTQWQRVIKDLQTCQLWLDKTKDLAEIEQQSRSVQDRLTAWVKLDRLQKQYKQLSANMADASTRLEKTQFLQTFNGTQLQHISEQASVWRQLITHAKRLKQMEDEEQRYLKQKNDVDGVLDAQQVTETVAQTSKRHETLIAFKEKVQALTKRLEEGTAFVKHSKQQEEEQLKRYNEALTALPICPTCGQPLHTEEESH
ncbi:AAA family ATPase [Shouchella sp. JSM 1781072]|uniref:AAA family ATPase n=1 Tax=Shouchella sp. JSM 1781072 TaxID=3344581 RepID=UPI0035BF6A9B